MLRRDSFDITENRLDYDDAVYPYGKGLTPNTGALTGITCGLGAGELDPFGCGSTDISDSATNCATVEEDNETGLSSVEDVERLMDELNSVLAADAQRKNAGDDNTVGLLDIPNTIKMLAFIGCYDKKCYLNLVRDDDGFYLQLDGCVKCTKFCIPEHIYYKLLHVHREWDEVMKELDAIIDDVEQSEDT